MEYTLFWVDLILTPASAEQKHRRQDSSEERGLYEVWEPHTFNT